MYANGMCRFTSKTVDEQVDIREPNLKALAVADTNNIIFMFPTSPCGGARDSTHLERCCLTRPSFKRMFP